MSQQPRTHVLALGVALAILASVSSGMAQTAAHQHEQGTQATPPVASSPAAGQQAMMARMMGDMQAQQKRLDEIVTKMNGATNQQDKIDQIAAAVTELASMHRSMHSMMMMMMQGGMMQHGAAGSAPGTTTPGAPSPGDTHEHAR